MDIKKVILFSLLTISMPLMAGEPTRAVKIKALVSSEDSRLSGQLFHPKLCPNNVNFLSFVRQEKDNRQLWFYDLLAKELRQISPIEQKESIEDFGESDESILFQNYTDQLTWCPVMHGGKQYVAYVCAGKGNNMDIYIHAIGSDIHTRITSHQEVDASPTWSPDGKKLAFVSARTGNGDIYMLQDVTQFFGKKITREPRSKFIRLTKNKNEDMLPSFSPDGQFLAYTTRTKGRRKRGPYTIALINFNDNYKIQIFNNRIVNSKSHPSWSFDGHFVAYQISNDLKDQIIDIGVLQLKKDPKGRLIELTDLVGTVPKIAENIFPNGYDGPSWLPGSRGLIYAKRESKRLNPLEIVNLEQWLYNQKYKRNVIRTKSSIHRDVSCLADHPIVVFAGQTGLTYKIFAAFLKGSDIILKDKQVDVQKYEIFQ
ncbi:MAG: PD40 domain-containing protein [Fibrobacteria bacterium]|nr:PD40 domain-containing protein [Fibrobacteria bacterium]